MEWTRVCRAALKDGLVLTVALETVPERGTFLGGGAGRAPQDICEVTQADWAT